MNEEYPIIRDIGITIWMTILISTIFIFFNINYKMHGEDFGLLISLLGVILGVLFTVLTILYAFEDNLSENVAFKELKAAGAYQQIYSIFTDSIAIIFFGLIILLIANFVKEIVNLNTLTVQYLFFASITFVITISIIRAYRCIFVYSLLQKVISKHKSNKEN